MNPKSNYKYVQQKLKEIKHEMEKMKIKEINI
jgi:hypothetical protein